MTGTPAPDFCKPIGAFERLCRKAHYNVMRAIGASSFTTRAKNARFVVNTTDFIDRELALKGIWEAEQLQDFAAICRSHHVDYFLDIGANAGVYSVLFAERHGEGRKDKPRRGPPAEERDKQRSKGKDVAKPRVMPGDRPAAEARPPREKPIDPDSPFAALMALKLRS